MTPNDALEQSTPAMIGKHAEGMNSLYLVRHAHADWVADEQRPLSKQGMSDALRVADLLAAKPITALYASPARRAAQTIEPLAARLNKPITTVHDLRERELSRTPVPNFLEAIQHVWAHPQAALPGGEPNSAAQRRGIAVIEALVHQHPSEQIVVATHGNLLALILQHYDGSVGFAFWQALTMPDVYQLSIDAGRPPAIQRLWS